MKTNKPMLPGFKMPRPARHFLCKRPVLVFGNMGTNTFLGAAAAYGNRSAKRAMLDCVLPLFGCAKREIPFKNVPQGQNYRTQSYADFLSCFFNC